MKNNSAFKRVKAIFLFAILLVSCQKTPVQPNSSIFGGTAMTMPYGIVFANELSSSEREKISIAISQIFEEIDSTFNNWNPDSEISKFNLAPKEEKIKLSKALQDLLTLCSQLVEISGGRFDPTIEPLQILWKNSLKEKRPPTSNELENSCNCIGWSHLQLKPDSLEKDNSDVRIDLCGIVKGLGVDLITEKLIELGYADFMVEWAGEFRAVGKQSNGQNWTVQINPNLKSGGRPLAPISLNNQALSTSADVLELGWILPAKSSSDGEMHRYFPLIDPTTAQPLEQTSHSIASVIVSAPSCALADALATTAMLFRTRKEAEKWAQEVVEFYPNVSFFILSYGNK